MYREVGVGNMKRMYKVVTSIFCGILIAGIIQTPLQATTLWIHNQSDRYIAWDISWVGACHGPDWNTAFATLAPNTTKDSHETWCSLSKTKFRIYKPDGKTVDWQTGTYTNAGNATFIFYKDANDNYKIHESNGFTAISGFFKSIGSSVSNAFTSLPGEIKDAAKKFGGAVKSGVIDPFKDNVIDPTVAFGKDTAAVISANLAKGFGVVVPTFAAGVMKGINLATDKVIKPVRNFAKDKVFDPVYYGTKLNVAFATVVDGIEKAGKAVYLDKAAKFVSDHALSPVIDFIDDKLIGNIAKALHAMQAIAKQIKTGAVQVENITNTLNQYNTQTLQNELLKNIAEKRLEIVNAIQNLQAQRKAVADGRAQLAGFKTTAKKLKLTLVDSMDEALVAIDELLVALAVGNNAVLPTLLQVVDEATAIVKKALVDLAFQTNSLKDALNRKDFCLEGATPSQCPYYRRLWLLGDGVEQLADKVIALANTVSSLNPLKLAL